MDGPLFSRLRTLSSSQIPKISPPMLTFLNFLQFYFLRVNLWSILNWFLHKIEELGQSFGCLVWFWLWFLHMGVYMFKHQILKRLASLHWISFVSLPNLTWTHLYGSMSRFCFTDLCVSLSATTTQSYYSLNSGRLSPLTLLFFSKLV